MKVNRLELKVNQAITYEEEISFSSLTFNSYLLKGIKSCFVKAVACEYGQFLSIKFDIKSVIVTTDAYTLEPIDYPVSIKEELLFSDNKDDEEKYFYIDNPIIVLDDFVYSLLVSSIPDKVVSKSSSLPKSGNGYRILSEEELEKEKQENKKSPFDKLDDLFVD